MIVIKKLVKKRPSLPWYLLLYYCFDGRGEAEQQLLRDRHDVAGLRPVAGGLPLRCGGGGEQGQRQREDAQPARPHRVPVPQEDWLQGPGRDCNSQTCWPQQAPPIEFVLG